MTTTMMGVCALLVIWLLACAALYRRFRRARWLAGGLSTATLAALGCTIAAATLVAGTAWLVPLALAVLLVVAAHLRAATTGRIEVANAGMLL